MSTDVNAAPTFTTFSEWRKNVHYKEMLEQVVAYNKYLRIERQERLPYLDSQTGVAQSDCFIWRSRHQRRRGCAPGQIFSYPPIRWKIERHHDESQDKAAVKASATVSTATGNVTQPVEKSSVVTRRAHVANDYASKKSTAASDLDTASMLQSDDSDSVGRGGDNNDASVVYDDSSSSSGDEGHIPKRKSARKTNGSRAKTTTSKQTTSAHAVPSKDDERPFVCNICGRRYKTLSVLKAHRTTYHSQEAFSHVEERTEKKHDNEGGSVMKIRDAKPNGYCDFCLGDDDLNKKTNKPEKLVSCADCGRSGHPSCLQFSPALMEIVMTYRWQCIECKSCHLCGQSDNDDQLLFCDDCDRGYHMYCVNPPIKEPPEGSWSCSLCVVRLAVIKK